MDKLKFIYQPNYLLYIFLTLKLCKVITWSWWWVLAPLWIPFIIGLIIFIIVCCLGWTGKIKQFGSKSSGTRVGSGWHLL
jgi:hypothetical protein